MNEKINFLNLIDFLCKNETQKHFLNFFQTHITDIFVDVYIRSRILKEKDIKRKNLKILRKSWEGLFEKNYLEEMRLKIMKIEKNEDIGFIFFLKNIQ